MKENSDLVSIIIPVYNSEKFIKETIKTVQNQTYKNWELILVNDCSTDNSKKIIEEEIKKDNKIKLINLKENSGVAIARNTGIDNAKGKYIAFLDSDDLWNEEKLKKQIDFMKEKQCNFSFTGYEFADKNGKGNGNIVRVPEKINYKKALKNTIIWTSTVVFYISNLSKEDIYMPNVKSEDTATWWKVLKNIEYAYGLDQNLSLYRRTKGTLSSNKFEAIKRIWNLYRKVEDFNIVYSMYNFIFYMINTIKKRL